MSLLPWLVLLGALAAAGAGAEAPEAPGGAVTTDPPPDESTPDSADAAEATCPRGCEACVADDVRRFFCGGQQLKYLEQSSGTYMELVCQEKELECGLVPALPARRGGALQRVELTACRLPPRLQLTCATGGERAHALTLRDALSSLSADNVRGLHAEELFLAFQPGAATEIPEEALAALPQLRILRLLHGTGLALRPGGFSALEAPLAYLEVSASGVRALPADAFRGLSALRTLNLWGNRIETIDVDAFKGLRALEKLVLSGNPLRTLAAGALARAPRLRELVLLDVALPALREDQLRGLQALQSLQLSMQGSANLTLGPRAFAELPALAALSVTQCGVAALPEDSFAGSRGLVNLSLADNRLERLPAGALGGLAALQLLDLRGNRLRALPAALLLPLAALRDLRLDRNALQELPPYVFAGLGRLRSVSLAHNRLRAVSALAFAGAASLRHVSLSHNRLAWAPPDHDESSPFNMLLQLETLELSHNEISTVYSDWRFILLQLRTLDLSHNNLTALSQADVQFLGSTAVDLTYNRISSVQPRPPWALAFADSAPGPARFALGHNPFRCDCHLYDFIMQVQAGAAQYVAEDAACSAPAALAGLPLARVPPPSLQCDMPHEPRGCRCRIVPHASAVTCRCNHTQVPEIRDTGMSHMELQLTRAPTAEELGRLPPYVHVLNLTDLHLTAVPDPPLTVQRLDLTGNDIQTLPDSMWNRSLVMYLADNPVACGCATSGEVALLQAHARQVVDFERVACAGGGLVALQDAPGLCDVLKSALAGAVLAAALVLAAAAAALLYRYRVEVQVLLYRRGWCARLLPAEGEDLGKKYDVFVSFARADERFVREEVLPRLEGRYTLHVRDRDWVVGSTIPAEIRRSIAESRRTLVLLSRSFYGSTWAPEHFRALHAQATGDRRLRGVVVLLDLKRKEMDKETTDLLSLSTVLRYNELMFWDKLLFALPRREAPETTARGKEPGGPWKGPGLDVVLNDEGKLINKAFVKDIA